MAAIVHTLGHSFENPSVYLSPTAHPVSSNPAANKINHAIFNSPPALYREFFTVADRF
jgi:hypothetical protein